MGNQLLLTCAYVSDGFGVHDDRWLAALRSLGHHPIHIARDHYSSESDFRDAVRKAATDQFPVIAGPLDIAQDLRGICTQLVLLSWGFDLQEAAPDLDLSAFLGVIVDSPANERIARRAGANQIVNIPWGIDIKAIEATTAIADLSDHGIEPNETVVLSLRAHEPRYRVADIIQAFARRPRSARLLIGNSGSLTGELRELAQELDVEAVFLAPVEESQVPALLRRASVYVTASEVDGTSVTLLQAMACNVPVVASANAGNIDWVEDGVTGFLYPIGDIETLDAAIEVALSSNPEIPQNARSRVAEFANWERNIQAIQPMLQGN